MLQILPAAFIFTIFISSSSFGYILAQQDRLQKLCQKRRSSISDANFESYLKTQKEIESPLFQTRDFLGVFEIPLKGDTSIEIRSKRSCSKTAPFHHLYLAISFADFSFARNFIKHFKPDLNQRYLAWVSGPDGSYVRYDSYSLLYALFENYKSHDFIDQIRGYREITEMLEFLLE